MKISVFSLLLVALLRSAGCDSDTESPAETAVSDCGIRIQVRDPLPRLTSDDYQVTGLTSDGTCLSVTLSATGCSSSAWQVALYTTGAVAESSPTQTQALLVFDDGVGDNEMTCQAIVEETYHFDLTPYLDGALPTTFTLTGTDTSVEISE